MAQDDGDDRLGGGDVGDEVDEEFPFHTGVIRPSNKPDAIEFIDVHKSFGRNHVLRGLNMSLPEDSISMIPLVALVLLNASQNFPFGGTSILIMVGVGLDTVKQIESQLQQRNYEGFLR